MGDIFPEELKAHYIVFPIYNTRIIDVKIPILDNSLLSGKSSGRLGQANTLADLPP
jgi:hypothetical protein